MRTEYKYRFNKMMMLFAAAAMLCGRASALTVNDSIKISPQQFPVLITPPNLPAEQEITFTNDRSDTPTLTLTNYNPAFEILVKSFELQPGVPQRVSVKFKPSGFGIFSDSLKVSVSTGEVITYYLKAVGVHSSKPYLSASSGTVDFGEAKAGSTVRKTLMVTNFGVVALTINSITINNNTASAFSVPSQSRTIAPCDSSAIEISFTPAKAGVYSAGMVINSNGEKGSELIQLSGRVKSAVLPSFALNADVSFADVNDIRNYRIIGLPGDNDIPVGLVLSGRAEFDWNAVWDNGQSTNYKVKYDGTAKFNFRAGNAFWIISRNPFRINKTAGPVVLSPENDYSIPLNAGWNLISNPFDKDINWADVRLVNSLPVNAVIYSWNGAYNQAQVFAPYKGYYFYNDRGLDSLKIPYMASAALSKGAASGAMNQLIIEAGNELVTVPPVRLGLDRNASDDYDELDYLMPPGDFESAGIRIFSSGLSLNYKYLSCEMRQGSGEGDVFELKVKNETGRDLTLRFKGADQFGSREVLLKEKGLSRYTDLKVCSEVTVPAGYKCRDYSVITGSRKFTEAMQKLQVPEDFAVMQNYPNPFNPSTAIRYSLPAACRVEISVYNMLGEKVAQLKNGFEEAGSYEVHWNAGGFSSGIYFCSVSAEQTDGTAVFKDVRKMVLAK